MVIGENGENGENDQIIGYGTSVATENTQCNNKIGIHVTVQSRDQICSIIALL